MDSPMSTDSDFDIDEDPNETVLGLIKSNVSLAKIKEALTQPNVQIDFQSASNGSFLYAAILKQRVDIVQLLIAKGADVTIKISKIKNNSPLKLVDKLLKNEPNNNNLQAIKKLLKDNQPGTSSMGSKSPKRKADQSNTQNQMSGLVDGPASILPKRPRIDNEQNVYNASGLTLSFHGVVFQVKLLMLFIHRAILNGYEFRLATEMDIAEKFDDVVLEYFTTNDPSKRNFILVQVKHRLDSGKSKITINDLKSLAGDFSLQKYFISFCKIKRNSHFQSGESSKYFIVTNTDFDFIKKETQKSTELIDKWRHFIQWEGNLCHDEILSFNKSDFKAEVYKLCDNPEDELKKIMKENLLASALETMKIKEFKSISDYFHLIQLQLKFLPDLDKSKRKFKDLKQEKETNKQNGKKILLTKEKLDKMGNDAIKLYKNDFVGKVTQNENEKCANKVTHILKIPGKMTEEQIDDVLSGTETLLKIVEEELVRVENKSQEMKNSNENNGLKGDEKKFEEYVNELKAKKINSSDSKEAKTHLDNVRETSIIEVALDDSKFDENFNDFIEHFRIFTNYPDELVLGELIKEELGDKFNLLDTDLAYAEFERDAFEILKDYKKGKAKFHTQQDALDNFNKTKRKIAGLMISGLGKSYPLKLRQYGIKFKKTIEELDKFLEPESKTQIFQLITPPRSTRLGAIRVLQSLDAIDEYRNKKDSFIFMRLRTLVLFETKILECFNSKKNYNLVVIEIQNKNQEKEDDLRNQLRFEDIILGKLLENRSWKKVIVIDSEDRKSIQKKFNSETKIEQIKFEDFDEKSQNKILKRDVNFQGNNIQWNQLINNTAAEDVFDHLILSTIIENGKISIGNQNAFSAIGYDVDCYVERKFCCPISKKIIEKKPASIKLFITGADKEVLTEIGAKLDDIVIYQNGQYHENGIIIPSSDETDQEYNEIFQSLGDDVHWLHYSQSRLLWVNSENDPLKLVDYIEDDEWFNCVEDKASDGIAIWDEMHFAEIDSSLRRTIVIANNAGMGKSTVLTSLAMKMRQLDYDKKEATDYRWIVRINLNDFAKKAHNSCLGLILFDENNKTEAIKFVTKMTIPGDPEIDRIVRLQQQIFKLSLEKPSTEKKTPKIVLMFDGFDEITPFYKEKTTTLFKALQASQVAQIWISTRVHERLHLQKKLNSFGYIVAPLSYKKQIEFTNKLWKWQLKFKKELNGEKCKRDSQGILHILNGIHLPNEKYAKELNECISMIVEDFAPENRQIELNELRDATNQLDFSEFCKKMIQEWKDSIGDRGNKFVINPLQLKMLSEIVFDNNFQLPKDLGLSNLYEKFIEMKFKISNTEKGNFKEGNQYVDGSAEMLKEPLYKIHEALAVDLFFVEYRNALRNLGELEKFQSNEQKKLEFVRRGILVLNGGRLEFIHQSFAEFFLSKYLIKNAEDPRVHDLLFPRIFVDDNFYLVREFFNKQLEKTEIQIELSQESMNLINDRLARNKPSLSSLIEDNHHRIFNLVFKAVQTSNELLENFLTYDYKKYVFSCAIHFGFNGIFKQLLEASLTLDPQTIKNIIFEFVHTIKDNQIDMIEILLNFIKENENYLGYEYLTDFIADVPLAIWYEEHDMINVNEKLYSFMDPVRDIFGANYVIQLFQHADLSDVSLAKLIECIKEDSDALYRFILECDQYGRTHLLRAMELNSIENLLKQFVESLCDQAEELNIVEDLAIISVCKKYDKRYNDNIDDILKIVDLDHSRVIHAKLVSIQDNLQTIKGKRKDLHEAIKTRNINEVENILGKCSIFEAKQILLMNLDDLDLYKIGFIDILLKSIESSKMVACLFKTKPYLLAIKSGNERVFEKSMRVMKNLVGLKIVRRVLFEPFLPEYRGFEYIYQWVEEKLGGSALVELIGENYASIESHEKALNTYHVEQINSSEEKFVEKSSENNRNHGILKDLAILTVYGDGRTDPCESIDKLLPRIVNDHEKLDILKKVKIDLNAVQETKKALDEAIRVGNIHAVNKILGENKDVIDEIMLISNENGQTALHVAALHVAAEHNGSEIIHVLFEKIEQNPEIFEEVIVKIDPFNKETPLYTAARQNNQLFVTELLNFLRNHRGILTKLLLKPCTENGLSIIADGEINQSILEWMNKNLDKDTVEELILEANSFKLIDMNTNTVLSNNIRNLENLKKHPEIATNVILQTGRSERPILSNAAEFYVENLDNKIKVFLQTIYKNINDFETLEDLAILSVFGDARTNPETVVDQLLKDTNITNEMPKMHEILMQIQSLINEIHEKWCDLSNAVLSGVAEQVQQILNFNQSENDFKKALLLMHNKKGQTTLYVAAEKNQIEIVNILLEKAEEYPKILDKIIFKLDKFHENTALQRAAQLGHHEIVLSLLNCFKTLERNFLRKNLLKNHFCEALKVAFERKHHQTVKVILEFADEYLPDIIIDQIRGKGDWEKIDRYLEWTKENSFLAEKLLKRFGETLEGVKYLLYHANLSPTEGLASRGWNIVHGDIDTSILWPSKVKIVDSYIKRALLEPNYTRDKNPIDVYIEDNNTKALDWIKKHFENDHDFLSQFVMSAECYETLVNPIFLNDWVNINLDINHLPSVFRKVLLKDFRNVKKFLEWIQQKFDEKKLEDLLGVMHLLRWNLIRCRSFIGRIKFNFTADQIHYEIGIFSAAE